MGWIAFSGLFFLSCSPEANGPLAISYQTEHLQIGSDLDHPICSGDLLHFEEIINQSRLELGVEESGPIDAYVWSNAAWNSQAAPLCGESTQFGCFKADEYAIYSNEFAFDHELVHYAVNDDNYVTAAHFVYWLRDDWGVERLGDLVSSGADAFRNFESVYGLPLTEAEAIYLAEAPAIYPALRSCDGPLLDHEFSTKTWRAEIELDCESMGTRASDRGLYATRTFVIDEPGVYNMLSDEGWLEASMCLESPVEDPPDAEKLLSMDIPPDYAVFPNGSWRYFSGAELHIVNLLSGRYRVRVGVDGFEPNQTQIAIWPSLGPQPELPDVE